LNWSNPGSEFWTDPETDLIRCFTISINLKTTVVVIVQIFGYYWNYILGMRMYYFLYTCFPVLTKSEMASLLRRSSVLTCQIVQKCTSRNISSTVRTVYKHKSRQLFSPGGVTRNLCGSKHVILSQTLTKNCNCRGLQTEGNRHLFLVKQIYNLGIFESVISMRLPTIILMRIMK
jgi:hypothetical protein